MRRLGPILLAVPLLVLCGWAACRALVSEETRIRWLVADMAAAFDEGSAGGCSRKLADDFSTPRPAVTKDAVHAGLARFFLMHRGGGPKYRVEVVEPYEVEVLDDQAKLALVARFFLGTDAQWEVAIRADLVTGPGGWKLRYAEWETMSGRTIFRF